MRYAWFLRPDRETFVALVQVDDDVENPIPGLPEFRELQETIAGGLAGIRSIVNPDKLQHLGPVGDFGSLVSEPATG